MSNKTMMRRFYEEVVNGRQLETIDELVAPEFREHDEFPGLPDDRDGLKQFFSMFFEAFPDLRMSVEDMIEEGDRVVARLRIRGTQEGEFMGIPPKGRSFDVSAVDIVRFQDGKAVEHWGATDSANMLQQLGGLDA